MRIGRRFDDLGGKKKKPPPPLLSSLFLSFSLSQPRRLNFFSLNRKPQNTLYNSSSLVRRISGAPAPAWRAAEASSSSRPSSFPLPLQSPSPSLSPLLALPLLRRRSRLASFPAVAAKKGGGGGQKKGPSLIPKEKPPYASVDVVMLTLLLVESYRRALGEPLIGGDSVEDGLEISAAPRALYEFPCAVLAHDRFSCGEGEEPKFTYANLAAQKVFESTWGALVGMESRESAELTEPDIQADRSGLLDRAATTGKAQKNYKGWRVSSKGKKFEIQDGVLFNVKSPSGEDVGQAVVFGHWKFEDGSEGGPNAPSSEVGGDAASTSSSSSAAAAAATETTPSVSLEAAEAAVAEQAAAVRALKDSGKSNSDPEVAAAVEELLRLKGVAAGIKGE